MNRARRLDQAFDLVEQVSGRYKFKPNVHVYTNLIQACVSNRSVGRAMRVLEQMVSEKVWPESRTYSILIRASLQQGAFDQAAGLLRGALGLAGALPILAVTYPVSIDDALVNETLRGLAPRREEAIQLLGDIRQHKPRVKIDVDTTRRVMSGQDECRPHPSGRRSGAEQRPRLGGRLEGPFRSTK